MSIPAGGLDHSTETRAMLAGSVAGASSARAPTRVLWLNRASEVEGLMPHAFDAPESQQAVGAVVAGADIHCAIADALDVRVAEWLLEAGARLHAVLGVEAESLRSRFALHADALQAPRLAAVLARCGSVAVAAGLLEQETEWQRERATALAAGRAMLVASDNNCVKLELQIGGRGCLLAEVLPQFAGSSETTTLAAGRRMAGIVFADFAGFRHIDDETMPLFWNRVFAAIGAAMAPLRGALLLGKTWGDGLHFVTCDAASAAELACILRETVAQQLVQYPQLQQLALRVAVHYAPVFVERDLISDNAAYIGSQLTYAARIEPVTPAGFIYASEACAAQLVLEQRDYQLLSEGTISLPKDHGRARVYRLEHAAQ